MSDKPKIVEGHVNRIFEVAKDCADEAKIHPEQNKDVERLAYVMYLLGESLAVFTEGLFRSSAFTGAQKTIIADELLRNLRKRIAP